MDESPSDVNETLKESKEKPGAGSIPLLGSLSTLFFARKKNQWLGDAESRVTRRLGWMPFAAEIFSNTRALVFNLILLLVTFALLGMVGVEIRRDAITLHPVPVPKNLSESGYIPEVVAARIAAELKRVAREAKIIKSRRSFIERQAEVEFQLPGQLVSFRTLVRFVRGLLGSENSEVSIDITENRSSYIAQIRVVGGPYDGSLKIETARTSEKIDNFIAQVGRSVMLLTEPVILASYEFNREAADCRLASRCEHRETMAILNGIVSNPSHPDYAWGLIGQAAVWRRRGQLEEALKTSRKAAEFDSKLAPGYASWGLALNDMRRHAEAIEKYQKAIDLDPKSALAYNNWGNSLQDLKRHSEAIEKYQKAIELDPNHTLAYNNWGNTLIDLKRHSEAIGKIQKAVELDPNYALAYNNWVFALQNLDRYSEAIEKYDKALEIDPNLGLARENREIAVNKLASEAKVRSR